MKAEKAAVLPDSAAVSLPPFFIVCGDFYSVTDRRGCPAFVPKLLKDEETSERL